MSTWETRVEVTEQGVAVLRGLDAVLSSPRRRTASSLPEPPGTEYRVPPGPSRGGQAVRPSFLWAQTPSVLFWSVGVQRTPAREMWPAREQTVMAVAVATGGSG